MIFDGTETGPVTQRASPNSTQPVIYVFWFKHPWYFSKIYADDVAAVSVVGRSEAQIIRKVTLVCDGLHKDIISYRSSHFKTDCPSMKGQVDMESLHQIGLQ